MLAMLKSEPGIKCINCSQSQDGVKEGCVCACNKVKTGQIISVKIPNDFKVNILSPKGKSQMSLRRRKRADTALPELQSPGGEGGPRQEGQGSCSLIRVPLL